MPASRLGSSTPTNELPVILYEAERSYITSVIVTNIGNVEHYFTIYVAPNGQYSNEEEWIYYSYQTKLNKFNSYESPRFAINEGDRIIVQSYLGEGLSFSVNGVYDSFGRTMVHTSISDPRDPAVGDIWVKTEGLNKLVFIWNGTAWTAMTDAFYSTTAPSTPEIGRFWIDSTDPAEPLLKTWTGSEWVLFAGTGASLAPYDAHIAATTNVHGISSTAALVYTDDARLSNARTPSLHATSHGVAGSDPVTIAKSQVTDLVGDLSTLTTNVNSKAPIANPSFTGSVSVGGLVKADGYYFSNTKNIVHFMGVLTPGANGPESTASSVDGDFSVARFNSPSGIAKDSSGNIYVADNTCVRKISNGVVSTIAGSLTTAGDTDAQGSSARFTDLGSILYNPDTDVIYVSDRVSGIAKIKRIDSSFNVTTLINLSPTTVFRGMAFDNNYDLIIAADQRIEKVTAAGARTFIAGNIYGFADGTGNGANFANPFGVAQLSSTEFLIADNFNYRIRKVNISNGVVTTYAGNGIVPDTTGALLKNGCIYQPVAVTVASNGIVYIGGQDNIVKFDPSTQQATVLCGVLGKAGNLAGNPGLTNGVRQMLLDESANRLYFVNEQGNTVFYVDLS